MALHKQRSTSVQFRQCLTQSRKPEINGNLTNVEFGLTSLFYFLDPIASSFSLFSSYLN